MEIRQRKILPESRSVVFMQYLMTMSKLILDDEIAINIE